MRLSRWLWMGAVGLAAQGALARTEAPAPAPAPAPTPAIEGAAGLILGYQPSYSGSPDMVVKARPAFFLRWGRFMLTNAGVFVTRRRDDVVRGLSADLLNTASLRVNAALRVEQGRQTGESPRLAGLDDIDPTIRLRLATTWLLAPDWRLGVAVAPDVLRHGGGVLADLDIRHDLHLGADQVLTLAAGVTAANARHLQSYYGVTPAQAVASGYAAYAPRAGLRDASAAISWRSELGSNWATYLGASSTRLLGPARRSPLTFDASTWSVSGGLAWRF